jgi:hypothetical protein
MLKFQHYNSKIIEKYEFVKKLSKGGPHVDKFLNSYPFQEQTDLEKAGPISRSPRARGAKKPASYKLESGDEAIIVDSTTDDDSYVSDKENKAKEKPAKKSVSSKNQQKEKD